MRYIPKRIIVPKDELNRQNGEGTYFKVWTPEDPFVTHPIEDVAYVPESDYATQAKRLSKVEAEIERMNKIYMSAVKQGRKFRKALRESREETKATDLAADMQRLDYAAELDALKAQLAVAIESFFESHE